jgi:carbon-monoxide dehydrogenase medium subunit
MQNVHPGLPSFDYVLPGSLAEASEFLAEHKEEARPFMGGTDIFVRMRDGFGDYRYLVDVKKLDGMEAFQFDPEQGLTLGAAVDMNRVIRSEVIQEHYPLLVEAASTVASYQLRSRATIAGNICNASPAGDTIGACLLLDANLQVHGRLGFRSEPLGSFFLGPGQTTLGPGDILTAIHFPVPPNGLVGRYIKLGRNQASDLAIVGVTAAGYPDKNKLSGYRIRLALASVAPVPLVVDKVEDFLSGEPVSEIRIAEAARIAQETCSPISDVRGGARYREMMVRNLSQEALLFVWKSLEATQ